MTPDLFAHELDTPPVSLRPDPRPFSSVVFSRQRDDWETHSRLARRSVALKTLAQR